MNRAKQKVVVIGPADVDLPLVVKFGKHCEALGFDVNVVCVMGLPAGWQGLA